MAETKIERISCSQIGEQYTHIQHKSGLSIYVSEMEGFSTTEALFGTKYGSINTQFKTKQEKRFLLCAGRHCSLSGTQAV